MTNAYALPIRVLMADDHPLLRDGLHTMLRKVADIEIVGEACNGQELITMAHTLHPDVIITDIEMPLLNGIRAARQLHNELPHIGIIALSMYGEDSLIVDMLEAGARGYLLKTSPKEELLEAIRSVHQGQTYYCQSTSSVLARLIAQSKFHPHRNREEPSFTPREKEIILLICQQLSNKEIADRLYLSIRTVESHRMHIQEKMQVKNAAGIVVYAIKWGMYML